MNNKLKIRLRRKKKLRGKIKHADIHRLSVDRTAKHIYAQVFTADGSKVVASASSVEKSFDSSYGGNCAAASAIGQLIAERAKKAGVDKVVFDRAWFKYHGRVKALADAARAGGLTF